MAPINQFEVLIFGGWRGRDPFGDGFLLDTQKMTVKKAYNDESGFKSEAWANQCYQVRPGKVCAMGPVNGA